MPQVGRDALALGVRREHLSRVIHGAITSKVLTARYRQLQGHPLNAAQRELVEKHNRRQAEKVAVPPG